MIGLILSRLINENNPSVLFGPLGSDRKESLKLAYQKLMKLVHPDLHPDDPDANAATAQVNRLWHAAQEQLAKGEYGKSLITPIVINSAKHSYKVLEKFGEDEIAAYFDCILPDGMMGIFKVVLRPQDSAYLVNEATFLAKLPPDFYYTPTLIETFAYREEGGSNVRRQASVFSRVGNIDPRGFVSLKEILTAYPHGVDPKDAVWMFRRLLAVVGVCGDHDLVHGGIVPSRVLIYPDNHGVMLTGWEAAVPIGESIGVVIPGYESFYPPEVTARKPATTALDIYMAVMCFKYLLGTTIPKEFRAFIRGCVFENPASRPQDAWTLLEEFDGLIERMWGKRTFHPFSMPVRTHA